jgi:FkbM family methyltransferase
VALEPRVAEMMEHRNLIVADVGAADGPEERWLGILNWVRFLNFEPKPRPDAAQNERIVIFPIGLWSRTERLKLQVTAQEDSCSLYPANPEFFRDFLIQDALGTVNTVEIDVDTLDHCVSTRPDSPPDFLKVDVEGGDLEVLRGSEQALRGSVLGVRAETVWVEMRQGAPGIADIHAFLRERGFVLFQLSRVNWIRKNGLHGFSSEPQLIWGDAVFCLGKEPFLRRLKDETPANRGSLASRFVVILLCHGIHDYAIELVEAATAAGLLDAADANSLKNSIIASTDQSIWHLAWSSCGLAFALAIFLLCLPLPGARVRGRYYVKQRAGRLFYELSRWAARGGRPRPTCVEDPFV